MRRSAISAASAISPIAPGLDFDSFARPGHDTEMVHFIGKDILYFHALFWPAMLHFAGYRAPTKVFAHGFLTVDGAEDVQVARHVHHRRSYLEHRARARSGCATTTRPSSGRPWKTSTSSRDFVARVNSDLVGKYVNIASRAAGFITRHFDGELTRSTSSAAIRLPRRRRLTTAKRSCAKVRRPRIQQGHA